MFLRQKGTDRPTSDIFPPMTQVIRPTKVGVAEVDHFTVSESESVMTGLSHRPYLITVPTGQYARLRVRGKVVMSDTRMERITNREAVRQARDTVLLGGLGLGMVTVGMLLKPEVETLVVVETESDVIAAVEPQVRRYVGPARARRLAVVCDDVFTYRPDLKFDVAYFDIWPEICQDNLPAVARLHQRYKGALVRGGERQPWMGSWMADWLRDERAADRRRGGWW